MDRALQENSEKIEDLSYKIDIIRLSINKIREEVKSREDSLKSLMTGQKDQVSRIMAKLGLPSELNVS